MTNTTVILSIVTLVAVIALIATIFKVKCVEGQKARLLLQMKQFAQSHNIQISQYEVLQLMIIGLDAAGGKLLVVERAARALAVSRMINLCDVETCVLEHQYSRHGSVFQKQERSEQRLEKILLHVTFHRDKPLKIVFFDHLIDPILELTSLAEKAEHWELMLSRRQTPQIKKVGLAALVS